VSETPPPFFVSVASKRLKLTVSPVKSTVTGGAEADDSKRLSEWDRSGAAEDCHLVASVASKGLSSARS
jgi:hypothetical protein